MGKADAEEQYRALFRAGDPLERPATVVGFELLRLEPDAALNRSDRSRGDRPVGGVRVHVIP